MSGPAEAFSPGGASVGREGRMPGRFADERRGFGQQAQQSRDFGRIEQADGGRASGVDQPGGFGAGAGGFPPGDRRRKRRIGFEFQGTILAIQPGRAAGPLGLPAAPAGRDGRGRRKRRGFLRAEDEVMRESVVTLGVVEPAGHETRQHVPGAAAGFEDAEREGGAVGAFVRSPDGFEQLGQPFRDGAVAGHGAVT
jgi:hypothetical protein